jgi:hypothetical protein
MKSIYEHSAQLRAGSFPAGPDSYRSLHYVRDEATASFTFNTSNVGR